MFRKLQSLSQKAIEYIAISCLVTGVLSAEEQIKGSQNLSITILSSASLTLEASSLEVIFDSSAGVFQEQVLTTGYHINNIGSGRDITGSIDHLPTGITISAEMAVPKADFGGDVLPISNGHVALTTTHNQMLSQIGKISGAGKINYKVTCDLNLADIEQLQAHTVVVSYVMAVTTG